MTARRHPSSSSPGLAGVIIPLLLIAFSLAVSRDWLGAPQLLQAGVDLWFGLWAWIGEQVTSSVTDALPGPDSA